MPKLSSEQQRLRTLQAMRTAGLDVPMVWMRYFQLSGDAEEIDVDAYLHGLTCLTPLDRDLISHAVNELINEQPKPSAPYSNDPDHSDYPEDPDAPEGPDDLESLAVLHVLAALDDVNHPNDSNDPDDPDNRNDRDDLNEDGRGQGYR